MTTTVQPPVMPEPITDKRIVPALIDGSPVYLDCPTWCTIDHVRDNQKYLVDVWHSGPFADLEAPRRGSTPGLVAYARLGLDPFSEDEEMRKPFVFVEDGNSAEGSYMGKAEATQFAANLIAFGEKVLAMANAFEEATA